MAVPEPIKEQEVWTPPAPKPKLSELEEALLLSKREFESEQEKATDSDLLLVALEESKFDPTYLG
jgi:hypothetical protein